MGRRDVCVCVSGEGEGGQVGGGRGDMVGGGIETACQIGGWLNEQPASSLMILKSSFSVIYPHTKVEMGRLYSKIKGQ